MGGGSNETAAIATLRNLCSCEEQFRGKNLVDLDGDGRGEFGFFQEMTAAAGLRAAPDGAARGRTPAPAVLSPSLAMVDGQGVVAKAGYCFRILLPARGGGVAMEGRAGEQFSGEVDTDRAEARWCAWAWPVSRGASGRRAFFVDERGEVMQCPNETARWSGSERMPAADAMTAGGEEWKVTN